ncbi:MFS general substrate transporter [Punctularia strigosozonata HHB-11173 SS5]|uniref:MFS general substrate transporter n=1 Tax=Punctularia strigosozonata (strain HHB-11173) TaxID=741275 RepID=UPI000441868D|nr:MFS general substrate transporter [Punctularia strigosozonata HHB-11173 SS5]EIN08318.1 MFS general substrate transporter [Punctularia strigosozonata HHB-11173 SS5]
MNVTAKSAVGVDDREKQATQLDEDSNAPGLDNIFARHGRVDLVPVPSDALEDPPTGPLSFHAFLAIFSAAIIIPAYATVAQAPSPRRPPPLQADSAICISPPMAIGAATVREMFFQHELGQKMGVWTLLVTIGPPIGPLIGGFIVQNKGTHWLFFLLAILNLALFFGYILFGFETLYMRVPRSLSSDEDQERVASALHDHGQSNSRWYSKYATFHRIDSRPVRPFEFVYPLLMARRPVVLLPTIAYTIVFAYAGVFITVLVPQFFQLKFNLNASQVGLQFISLIVGAVLGEQLAGWGSDRLVRWRAERARNRGNGDREPEMRLLASYPGFVLATAGLAVWGVQLQNAPPGKWNVTPDVGGGIAYFGLQLVTTPLYAYCLESYQADAAAISSFMLVAFGFTVPFCAADGAIALGDAKFTGLLAALTGASIIPILASEIWGRRWRDRAD